MPAIIGYITTANREEALRIGTALLAARLAACINIMDGMHSMYWWQGRMETAQECVLLVKSTVARQAAIVAKVRELHGYSVPCVVFWPITDGNADYLAWIEKESGDA